MRSVLLEKLFLDHQLKMKNCDGGTQEDCYWCIYENEEGDVYVVVEYYFDNMLNMKPLYFYMIMLNMPNSLYLGKKMK